MSLCSAQLTHGPAEELTCHLLGFIPVMDRSPSVRPTVVQDHGASERASEQASLAGGELARLCESVRRRLSVLLVVLYVHVSNHSLGLYGYPMHACRGEFRPLPPKGSKLPIPATPAAEASVPFPACRSGPLPPCAPVHASPTLGGCAPVTLCRSCAPYIYLPIVL